MLRNFVNIREYLQKVLYVNSYTTLDTIKDFQEESFIKPNKELSNNSILLVCSSDKGLCGAIHSSLSKSIRTLLDSVKSTPRIVILGDKAKPQIARKFPELIAYSFNNISKNGPSIYEALSIMNFLGDFSKNADLFIYYNKFKSVISYSTEYLPYVLRASFISNERSFF